MSHMERSSYSGKLELVVKNKKIHEKQMKHYNTNVPTTETETIRKNVSYVEKGLVNNVQTDVYSFATTIYALVAASRL